MDWLGQRTPRGELLHRLGVAVGAAGLSLLVPEHLNNQPLAASSPKQLLAQTLHRQRRQIGIGGIRNRNGT